RSSSFCRRNNLRDDQVSSRYRAAATAPLKSEDRPRSLHNLPEVPRERSEAPVFVRSRTGRRSRTLAKARTDSGAAHWSFRARKKMGTAQSKHRSHGVNGARPRGAVRDDRLEKRICP